MTPPPAIEGRASVVWIAGDDVWARSVVLAAGAPPYTWPNEVAFEAGTPIDVLVVDGDGTPVEGAAQLPPWGSVAVEVRE